MLANLIRGEEEESESATEQQTETLLINQKSEMNVLDSILREDKEDPFDRFSLDNHHVSLESSEAIESMDFGIVTWHIEADTAPLPLLLDNDKGSA